MLALLSAFEGAPRTQCKLPPNTSLRIVALGDSLTRGNTSFGNGIGGPSEWPSPVGCWPCELSQLLGKRRRDVVVDNLGRWGAPVMTHAHAVAAQHSAVPLAEDLPVGAVAAADVVLVMLGTNDAKSREEDVNEHFATDFIDLMRRIFRVRSNSTRCTFMITPPRMHAPDGTFGLRRSIVDGLRPRLQNIGRGLRLSVIDGRSPLEGDNPASAFGYHLSPRTGDGVHPPAEGMRRIAMAVMLELERFGL
jgi:hypothetical protein